MTISVSKQRRAAFFPTVADADASYAAFVMAAAGAALLAILAILAFTTADWPFGNYAVPPFVQIVRNAQLFHDTFPFLAAFAPEALAVVMWACVLGMWLVYVPLVWTLRSRPIDHRVILTGAITLGLLAIIVPPVFSTDPFSYAMFGRFAAVYHHNPYLSTARTVAPGDPLMPYLYWRDIPSPYGPLWTLISQVVCIGGDATPLSLVLRFKAIGFSLVLLDGWLIHRLVRQRWPERASWTYLAFAWNPVVLIEGIVIGHNDVLILAVMLGSALLLARARPVAAVLGLTASALIKYSTLPVVGLCGIRLLLRDPPRARPWLALRLIGAALAVSALAFLPYWAGYASVMSTVSEPGRGLNNLIPRIVLWILSFVTLGRIPAHSPAVAVTLSALTFGVWQVVTIWRSRERLAAWTIHDELASWSYSLTVFLMLWPRMHTWYFLVPLGLALAAGRARPRTSFWFLLGLTIYSYISYFW